MGFIISYRHRSGSASLGLGRSADVADQESARKYSRGSFGEGRDEGIARLKGAGRHSWMVVDPQPVEEDIAVEGEREKLMGDVVPVIRPGDFFTTMEGDSMLEAGLCHGQSVVVRPDAEVHDGDICAIWIDGGEEGPGEGVIARVYRGTSLVRLVPASPRYRSSVYPAASIRILGVVVATLATQIFQR